MTLIHDNAGERSLNFAWNWVFGIWLIVIILDPLASLSTMSKSLFWPTGLMIKFMPESLQVFLLQKSALFGLKLSLIISLLCVLLKIFQTPAAICSCILLTIHQGFVRSFGHLDHTGVLILYAAYILVLCRLADLYTRRKSPQDRSSAINLYSVPLIFILIIICFSYTFTGIHRIIHGGWELFNSDAIILRMIESSNKARIFSWHFERVVLEHSWLQELLKAGFPAMTVIEILAPFSLISRWFRYCFIGAMIPFHIIIWLLFGVLFLEQMALFVLFFNISSWLDRGDLKR